MSTQRASGADVGQNFSRSKTRIMRFAMNMKAALEIVSMCVENYGGDEAKEAWRTVLVESAPSASTNTGSPKLPTLEVCIANLYRDTAAGTVGLTAVEVAKNIHGYISRQLRAGA
jgi:hypothetical protein